MCGSPSTSAPASQRISEGFSFLLEGRRCWSTNDFHFLLRLCEACETSLPLCSEKPTWKPAKGRDAGAKGCYFLKISRQLSCSASFLDPGRAITTLFSVLWVFHRGMGGTEGKSICRVEALMRLWPKSVYVSLVSSTLSPPQSFF